MAEIYEMENYEATENEGTFNGDSGESGNRNGSLVTGLIIGGAALAVGGAIAATKAISKKIKAKKEDKPAKQKTKLKLFARVPVEEAAEEPVEKVEAEVVETKEDKKAK